MKITILYVGSSLLGPLRRAERDIEESYQLGLHLAAHNFGAVLNEAQWREVERDVGASEIVFVFHVTDGENASRLMRLLATHERRHAAVICINCMPDLMRCTRMGKLRFGSNRAEHQAGGETEAPEAGARASGAATTTTSAGRATKLVRSVGAWMGEQVRANRAGKRSRHTHYLKLIERLPGLLRFVPGTGRLRDVKNYLYLFCYFLQPTPQNIRSMLLYALTHYVADERLGRLNRAAVLPPEALPAVAIYHPDATALFASFEEYRSWYERRAGKPRLAPDQTIGLLLMRTQIISGTHRHYDYLIRAIESEGLAVLPAISTFMDNREACEMYFVEVINEERRRRRGEGENRPPVRNEEAQAAGGRSARSRVSQIVSLTGFSFVGGPAMNDSAAATQFLRDLNCPFRSTVSLDVQTIESWQDSWSGLNPVQTGMQIAIPEIDGATEPLVYGGMTRGGAQPIPLEDRCQRIARRLTRWNRLRTARRADLNLALLLFCFPPNKGNMGTAADLDVFPSVWETIIRLQREGYAVEVPASAEHLREMVLGGDSGVSGGAAVAHVGYRMNVEEYRRLCPYVEEIEAEWGAAPGAINSFGDDLLIHGVRLGRLFIGVQPTFGYEGDPTRLLMARSGAPHHGFAALYTYLAKVFAADAVVHVGTHGALEFMPGKQVGLSAQCWPDRLIGELPHIYLYSVNNPSEGSIARRRSYAELISYLTPPIEDAGVYRDLASLKELLAAYRQSGDADERRRLYAAIEEKATSLHLDSRAAAS